MNFLKSLFFGKTTDKLVYGSSENPRPLRRVDSVKEDLRTTMEHFLELKDSLHPCIKEVEARALEADARAERYENAFDDADMKIRENGGNYWEDKSSYPEVSALWDKSGDAIRERQKALEELREWMKIFRWVYGYEYRTQVYENLHTSWRDIF